MNYTSNNNSFPPGGGMGRPGGGMGPPGGGMGPPGGGMGPLPGFGLVLASFYIHCLSSRLFRQEFFNVIHIIRNRRIGAVTQILGFEATQTQTQTQLIRLQGGKFTKA
ncbi:unnamed protein product [Rotaria sordida]|uniref:Uncharacterized protein n=1 Tax=Rotaria sordida TaxID=392033 RepID=A0A815JNT5_9BILA|nr:unnamed protein product [Rotaria sordida]CAF4175540.1 unnamed protein product [Rotaria sordida]